MVAMISKNDNYTYKIHLYCQFHIHLPRPRPTIWFGLSIISPFISTFRPLTVTHCPWPWIYNNGNEYFPTCNVEELTISQCFYLFCFFLSAKSFCHVLALSLQTQLSKAICWVEHFCKYMQFLNHDDESLCYGKFYD